MTFELWVPVYNERTIIKKSLERICQALDTQKTFEWNVVVVDNASTDDTGKEVLHFSDPRVRLLRIEEKGKGAAIIAAARSSVNGTASVFGFIDVDLSAEPSEIIKLIGCLESASGDIVIGSRLLDTATVSRGMFRTFSSKVFNIARRMLLGVSVKDSQCGLKVMNKKGCEILSLCTEKGWFLDLEFLAKAERAGLHIFEISVRWNEYEFQDRTSKLRIVRDGFASIFAMFRIRKQLRMIS